MSQTIAQWADELDEARDEQMLDPKRYPLALGLAFISIESNGVPTARKFPTSQFYGLLQMGRYAGIDVGFADKGRKTSQALHGHGEAAIRYWYEYMARYEKRWVYESEAPLELRAAILWKGGAGTARRIRDTVRAGERTFWEAVRWIETHPNKRWRINNLEAYLRRMERAYPRWEKWVEEEYSCDAPTPSPDMVATAAVPEWLEELLARGLKQVLRRFAA